MNVRITAMAAVLAIMLAGCGGAAATGSGQVQQARPPSAAQVAADHGLTITDQVTPPTLFAAEEAHATGADGASYEVVTFVTNTARDNWVKTAGEFGSVVKWSGDRWVIASG